MQHWQAQKTYAVFSSPANKKVISEIRNAGANVIEFPAVNASAVELDDPAQQLLRNPAAFDWLIFPDVFAVDYFLQALERLEIDLYELDAARVCAYGETVSDRLRYSQVHADVISNTIETEQVFQALRDYEPNLDDSRFLIVKEFQTEPEIARRLGESGASVSEIPIYQTQFDEAAVLPKLKALVKGGAIDEFVFCSVDEIMTLAILFRPEKPLDLLSEIEIAVFGASAYQSLREYGFVKIKMR